MFKKLKPDRPPGVTIGGELRKELAPYFRRINEKIKASLCRYSKRYFLLMVAIMLGSGILAFTVMRNRPMPLKMQVARSSLSNGFGQLIGQATALNQLWQLQGEIDALLKKPHPDHADSALIASGMAQMDSLQKAVHAARRQNISSPKTVIP